MTKRFTQDEKQQYIKMIQYKFSDLYFKNNNPSHSINQSQHLSSINSLGNMNFFYVTAPHRQEIFFAQYPLEKKGKKFGTSEMRLLKCVQQSGKIYQVDKNRQAKQLPLPNNFKIQTKLSIKDSNQIEWNAKLLSFEYRIKLMFEERGQIFVYFDMQQNCFEIAAFLKSLLNKQVKKFQSLLFGSEKFNENILINFKQKLINYRKEVQKRKQLKKKLKGIKKVQTKLNDKSFIINMMEKWRLNTFFNESKQSKKFQVKFNLRKVWSSIKLDCQKIIIKNSDENKIYQEISLSESLEKNSKGDNEENNFYVYTPTKYKEESNKLIIGLKDKLLIYLQNSEIKSDNNEISHNCTFSVFQIKYLDSHSNSSIFQCNNQKGQQKDQLRDRSVILKLKIRKPEYIEIQNCQQNQNLKNEQNSVHEQDLTVLMDVFWRNEFRANFVSEQNNDDSQKLTMPSRIYQSQVKVYQQTDNHHSQSYFCQKQQPHQIQYNDYQLKQNIINTNNTSYKLKNTLQIYHYFPLIQNQAKTTIPNDCKNQNSPHSPLEVNYKNNSLQNQNTPFTIADYTSIYKTYTQINHPVSLLFNCAQKLTNTFKIPQLINKFLLSQTFKPYSQNQYKATKIFSLLIKKSESIKYYDVQKLIIQFGNPTIRKILNAIKTFDQSLRINFTQPLYKLAERVLNIVKESFLNLQQCNTINQLFDNTTILGVQSCAFFITLGIIKQFSALFIYQKQLQKRSLHQNTLLFKLVLKKQFPQIWKKCSFLQLNIETLFGISFVSLLSDYFSNNIFVQLVCQQAQQLSQNDNKNSNKLYHHLIATFIALLQHVMATYSDQILSGQSLIIYLQQKSHQIDISFTSSQQIQKIKHLIHFHSEGEYVQLVKQLNDIYADSAINKNNTQSSQNNRLSFGTLSHAVYSQFTDDRQKNMTESRLSTTSFLNDNQQTTIKTYLFINALHFDQSINVRKMLMQIYQGKHLLYSHQFKNIDIQTFILELELQLKNYQNLVLYIKTKPKSYYYVLNVQKLQSNCYHHFISPLADSVKQNAIQTNQFIEFEVFLKNHVLGQRFQNVTPSKYCQTFIYNSQIKESILQTTRFLKNYRMKDNNFNLLYTKLAWYGNHYLIPHDRLLSVHIFDQNQFMTDQASTNHLKQKQLIFSTMQYTRTIFGKGIVPKIKSKPHSMAMLDMLKNNIRVIKSIDLSHQSAKNLSELVIEHKSSNELLTYGIQNFDMQSIGTFFEFFNKMCQLPLIDYLTYDPLSHYVLPLIQFNSIYINYTQGIKLKFAVFLCDSVEERKQGEPWEEFVDNFTIDQLQRLQAQFQALQAHFFNKDYKKNPFASSSHNESSQRASRFGFVSTQQNMKMKQFYTMFPQTFNFSFPNSFNLSIDTFSLKLKYNILRVILNKFSKINMNIKKNVDDLQESVIQTQQQINSNPLNHHYHITLIQDNTQIPNLDFYYLFRFMIQTGKQLHVNVQLKKEKMHSSTTDIQNLSITNLHSPRGTENSSLSATMKVSHDKNKVEKNQNKIKTFSNMALIYGKYCFVEILSKQFKPYRSQSSSNLSTSQSRAQTVIQSEPQSPAIILPKNEQKQSQQIKFYLVEQRVSRKIHRLREEDILWKDSITRQIYESL